MPKKNPKQSVLDVQGAAVSVISKPEGDFVSLTDMAKKFGEETLIYNWMRNRNTLEYLGIWEKVNNPNFKGIEFDTFKTQAGLNSFTMTPRKWIDATGAIGVESRAGRYGGGTYAHVDIAFEFGTWLSPEFKLYLIREFQRLKDDETRRMSLDWNLNRALSKLNYKIHTDAIKEHIIPQKITGDQAGIVYANEADLLNVALFGKTAKQWRDENPGRTKENIRDDASVHQLLVMANIESMNAEFIRMGITQSERLKKLNEMARNQLKALLGQSKKLEAMTAQPALD